MGAENTFAQKLEKLKPVQPYAMPSTRVFYDCTSVEIFLLAVVILECNRDL